MNDRMADNESRVECQCVGQNWRFQLSSPPFKLNGGLRYLARDVSAPHLELAAPGETGVVVELWSFDDQSMRREYLSVLETFQRVASSSQFWRLLAYGVVAKGPHQGQVLVAGEPWKHLLSENLEGRKSEPTALAESVYFPVAESLFLMHEHGVSHGGVSPEALAYVVNGDFGSWKLRPAAPNFHRRKPPTPPEDLHSLGEVIGRIFDLNTKPSPRPKVWPSHINLGWQRILNGCLSENPQNRWKAGRALFGFNDLPVAGPLTQIPGPARYQIEWPEMENVLLYEVAPGRCPEPPGTVRVPESLYQYGQSRAIEGNSASIVGPYEGRILQTVTQIDDIAVVFGHVIRLSEREDVTNLDITIDRGRLRASWDWPTQADLVVLGLRADRYPSSPKDAHLTISMTREAYYKGKSEITENLLEPAHDTLFVAAFAAQYIDGQCEYASGASLGSRWTGPGWRHQIRYGVEASQPVSNSDRRVGTHDLVLSSCTDVKLPELALQFNTNHSVRLLPLSERLLSIPVGTELKSGVERRFPFTVMFQVQSLSPRNVKLLVVNEADNRRVELLSNDPTGEKL